MISERGRQRRKQVSYSTMRKKRKRPLTPRLDLAINLVDETWSSMPDAYAFWRHRRVANLLPPLPPPLGYHGRLYLQRKVAM